MPRIWQRGPVGDKKLHDLAALLKAHGRGKAYDAMIGLSGGVDSAYLAHIAVKKMGLRVLAVHVDAGWNNEAAVRNIESIVRRLDIDLHTVVIEWEEIRDLQLAFLKASVLNQDIPQDHAFFATLYRTASKFNQGHFLSGVNFSSEGVSVPNLGYPAMDGYHLKSIYKKFGNGRLKTYPIMGLIELVWLKRIRKQLQVHQILDFIDYNKLQAIEELREHYDWVDYGHKHCESRFTKFYQEVYLPRKFGFDKRGFHLSSLIVSGQMTRDQALKELEKPITSDLQANRDIKFVAKKLEITTDELRGLIESPPVEHASYPSQRRLHERLTSIRDTLLPVTKAFKQQ